jgi:Flp pilus assembly protein TadD
MSIERATLNTDPRALVPQLNKPRLLLEAAAAVAVFVPLVMIGADHIIPAPSIAAGTPASFDEEIAEAVKLLNSGKPRESLVMLERARLLNPSSFSVYNNQCVAYGLLARRDEAVVSCGRALELEPTNQLGINNLAWVKSITSPAR